MAHCAARERQLRERSLRQQLLKLAALVVHRAISR
jgi:hypothetical protein